jgi:PHD/YefM family antitoxin component YafN of YafNO toxin-antitoxin module
MQIVPMRDLKDTKKIQDLCTKSHDPVIVTKNGHGCLVVMDYDFYDKVLREMYEAKLVNEALESIAHGGKVYTEAEFKERIKKKYGL